MSEKKTRETAVYVREETLEELLFMLMKKLLGTVVYVRDETLRNCCLCKGKKPVEELLFMLRKKL